MINNGYILTAAEMLAAEQRLIDQGTSVETLMERAGQGAAQQIWRIFGNMPTLVLCGPGNNGGDGYVIAEWLRQKDVPVSVAATGRPKTEAASKARELWKGDILSLDQFQNRSQIVDCLFGTGLKRPISGELLNRYLQLCGNAKNRIAIDVPSGVDADTGQLLNEIPDFDLTIALGATKPAHYLEPARSKSGKLLEVDIGIDAKAGARRLKKPVIAPPKPIDHKYTRGLVAVIAGKMHGAAKLVALSAQNAGAGYTKIFAPPGFQSPGPSIVVETFKSRDELAELIKDRRLGALVLGPGLGRDEEAELIIDKVLAAGTNLVIDADALSVLGESLCEKLTSRKQPVIATPHEGEFCSIYRGDLNDKINSTRDLAKKSQATILYKGSDTTISDPAGNVALSGLSNSWLSTAGTGDILSGMIAARLASGMNPFEAAQQGQWLHTRAAQIAGPSFSPETLIECIPKALAECS